MKRNSCFGKLEITNSACRRCIDKGKCLDETIKRRLEKVKEFQSRVITWRECSV